MKLNTIAEAIKDIKQGKMLIVVDDAERENEGDLVMAAKKITAEAINFMITHARGLVCVPMLGKDLARLELPQMINENTDPNQTAFTVSVDHLKTTTGISAYERAFTIKNLIDRKSSSQDFRRPGHIFPLRAKDGGVLIRPGHTEAAVDLAKLAGLFPAGVICEIIRKDGKMARLPELFEFAAKWQIKIISIADLIDYFKDQKKLVKRVAEVNMPTKFGEFKMYAYSAPDSSEPHLALIKGTPHKAKDPVLVRVHSECLTGDVLGSERCDCGKQLAHSLKKIEQHGTGIMIYLRQEGRGIGLLNKLKAYELQEEGYDTVEANLQLGYPAELRDFQVSATILKDLGVTEINLMTNNPLKIKDLNRCGINIVHREPLEITPSCSNHFYLKTKKERMGHLFSDI